MYPYQVLIAKEEKKLETINSLDFSSLYYLIHAFYLPLYFNAKLKIIQGQGSSKEQCSGQATKLTSQIMAYANLLLFK